MCTNLRVKCLNNVLNNKVEEMELRDTNHHNLGHSNGSIGDLVLIHTKSYPRGFWQLTVGDTERTTRLEETN